MGQGAPYGVTDLSGLNIAGVPTMGMAGAPLFTGRWLFVDPVTGSDGNQGTPQEPLGSLYQAHALMTSGNNDVAVIVGDGSTTATIRLSTANAQTITSSATAGTLTWSKSACHLIGMAAPTMVSQRARIAPPSGTYTQSTFGSGNFITVSGSGCYFANFSIFNGFSTGGVNQIALTVSGGRNYFSNVMIGGMGDDASAQDTGSRSLLISTTGENTFDGCEIGLDTVTRTVANSSLQISGGAPRNTFRGCNFPFQTSAATVVGIMVAAAAGSDRWQLFRDCTFINNVKSTSTAMTGLASLAASMGGLLLFKNSTIVGITKWGIDATSLAQIYVDGAAPTAATSGIAVNPT